jgi:galactose mutarotase-like enzyme
VFLPELGMAGCSLTHDGVELVALDGGLDRLRAGGATGFPLLAPWANRLSRRRFEAAGVEVDLDGVPLHDDGRGLPIHGTMIGERQWEVVEERPDGVRARFRYEGQLLRAFPFPHTLEIDATVAYAQVFSPDGADFVAIEPMTAPTDALTSDECPLVDGGERSAAVFEVAASAA